MRTLALDDARERFAFAACCERSKLLLVGSGKHNASHTFRQTLTRPRRIGCGRLACGVHDLCSAYPWLDVPANHHVVVDGLVESHQAGVATVTRRRLLVRTTA